MKRSSGGASHCANCGQMEIGCNESYSRGEPVKKKKKKEIHLREGSFQTAQCAVYKQVEVRLS